MSSKKDQLLAAAKESMGHIDKVTLKGKVYVEDMEVSLIHPNPYQPRLNIDEKNLQELICSIEENGLLQPVPVMKLDNKIILIAGHRRLEAHKRIPLRTIKAILFDDVTKQDLASLALVENMQRVDLHIIEIAIQYKALIDNRVFKAIKDLALAVGKDPGDVGKIIKLLQIADEIIEDVLKNKTTSDLKILDAIRSLKDEQLQKDVYLWFVDTGASRDDVIKKVQELKNQQNDNATPLTSFKIENNKKACIIKLPHLKEKELVRVENFINTLFGK